MSLPALATLNLRAATKRNAITLRDTMKKTINAGQPEWLDLKPATIKRKGSSKPLIDTGDMRNSINQEMIDGDAAFIGIPRAAKNRDGDDLVSIAAVQIFGSKKAGIPPRDFILPAYNAVREKMIERYREAARATIKGQRYHAGRTG
jgi:phage gpG-like protein